MAQHYNKVKAVPQWHEGMIVHGNEEGIEVVGKSVPELSREKNV